jgi:hypothetical protein
MGEVQGSQKALIPTPSSKSLYFRFSELCHGRGRGFESRRPRHSLQKAYKDFAGTSEGAKGHVCAPFLHPFFMMRRFDVALI